MAGCPTDIFLDHDNLIASKFFKHLCLHWGIDKRESTIYIPNQNGRAETVVRLVLEHLRQIVLQFRLRWGKVVPQAVLRLNATSGVGGGLPHLLVSVQHLRGFGDNHPGPSIVRAPDLDRFIFEVDEQWVTMAEKFEAMHQLRAEYLNTLHEKEGFEEGARVLVRVMDRDDKGKLYPHWTGPHEVLDRAGSRYWVNRGLGTEHYAYGDLHPF